MELQEDRVWRVIRDIPAGSVLGYGEVAARAGFPRRARWVARLLAQKTPPGLPWYRVVKSDGRIAFAVDSAGFKRQAAALRKEGVEIRNGKVVGRKPVSEDARLWGPPA